MTLKSTKEHLVQLLGDKENKVVALTGKWGTGKSYLWQHEIKKNSNDEAVKNSLYVSLFGLSDLDQVKLKLYHAALPSAEERPTRFQLLRYWIGRGAGRIKVLEGLHKGFAAIDGLLMLMLPSRLKKHIIVIDDIERKHKNLSVDEILGFIDEYTQQHDARFIMIMNDDQLNDKAVWEKLREKVVDQEIRLDTTSAEAFAIAIGMSASPYAAHIAKYVETCSIVNIRIIRKVIGAVNRILGERKDLSEDVLDRTIPSIVLLAAIHYRGIDHGPDVSFVLRAGLAEDFAGFENKSEELNDEDKKRATWNSLLHKLGIYSSDAFEVLVAEYLQAGQFDDVALRRIIDRYVTDATSSRAVLQARQLMDHLLWHPQLTDEQLLGESNAALSYVHLLGCFDVTNLSEVVSELTGGAQVANQLVDKWIAHFNTLPKEDYVDFVNNLSRPIHPRIKAAFDARNVLANRDTSLLDACKYIRRTKGWGPLEESVMQSATVNDIVTTIKSLNGDDLQTFMFQFMDMTVSSQGSKGFGMAATNFKSACQEICADPTSGRYETLIRRLFKNAGREHELQPTAA